MESHLTSANEIASAELAFSRYVRTHQEYLHPDGIYCKRNAIWLAASIGKRVPTARVAIGKVNRTESSILLQHKVGGNFDFHYVVLFEPNDESSRYVFDPLLFTLEEDAVPASEYLESAYANADSLTLAEVVL